MRLALPASVGAFLAVALAVPAPCAAQEGPWALTNARIETVTTGVIERGTIVVREQWDPDTKEEMFSLLISRSNKTPVIENTTAYQKKLEHCHQF